MTDFRGSGLLGLKHLWQFNIADSRAEKVFKVGTGQKTWYFFAATGINISGKVIEFIEEGKCDKYFYEQNEEINFYLFTQKLYYIYINVIIIDFITNIIFFICEFIWKKIKKIIYLITRTHQIERILNSNIQSFSTFLTLSN